jgi:hypothetical protein
MKYVNKQKGDFNPSEDMNEQQLAALERAMGEYSVPFPQEYQIDLTVDTLRQYVPSKRQFHQVYLDRLGFLFDRAVAEVSFISKIYWLASIVLFVTGYIVAVTSYWNFYGPIVILAPIPFVLGMLEVFKGREKGVLEIELTCKISAREIMLSRLVLIGVYNILLNTLFSTVISMIIPKIVLWKILLLWITPFTGVSAVALWLAMKVRGGYAVTLLISGWVVAALSVILSPKCVELFEQLNILGHVVINGLGVLLILLQVKKILLDYYPYFERSVTFEVNN